MADRGKFIAAVLTIARAYLCAGEPQVEFQKLASFSAWSRFVQKPLIWLGQADPVLSVESSAESDPDRSALLEVFTLWHEAMGEEKTTVKKMAIRIQAREYDDRNFAHPELRQALLNVAPTRDGTLDAQRFGKWLGWYNGRIVGGLKLQRCTEIMDGAAAWRVTKVK